MQVSPNFKIMEYVPKEIYQIYSERSIWFVDQRLIDGMQWLRDYFGASIIINNWHNGGTFQNRGFRHPTTTVGARLSQHKFGRACDFNVMGLTAKQTFEKIRKDWGIISGHTFFTTIEDVAFTPTWTHLDGRDTGSMELLIVKP